MKKCVAIETSKLIGIGIGKFVACTAAFIAAISVLGYILYVVHIPEWINIAGGCIVAGMLLLLLALLVLSWAHKKYEEAQVICMMRAEREDRRRP